MSSGAAEAGSGRRTILVVEDDALIRMSLVDMLEDLGHAVVEAGSGREALAILSEGQPVDVMITDQSMPGMTGSELARAVRGSHGELPILLATGYVDVPDDDLNLPLLAKPYDLDQLAKSIGSILERN